MPKPSAIQVPPVPLRTQPSTFEERAGVFIDFLATFAEYLSTAGEYADAQALASEIAASASSLTSAQQTALNTAAAEATAGKVLAINAAGTGIEAVDAETAAFATQAEAEAGTVNNKNMSPLRVQQALGAFSAGTRWERIRRRTASNSSAINFTASDFDSSVYADYRFIAQNIVPSIDARKIYLRASNNGGASWTAQDINLVATLGSAGVDESGGCFECLMLNFHAGKGAPMIVTDRVAISSDGRLLDSAGFGRYLSPSSTTPTNYIRFYAESGNIESGDITLYGARR